MALGSLVSATLTRAENLVQIVFVFVMIIILSRRKPEVEGAQTSQSAQQLV